MARPAAETASPAAWLAVVSLTGASLAWAAKSELNLTHGRSSDPAVTALIVTEQEAGADQQGLLIWLHGVTDLSLPEDQRRQVLLSDLNSFERGHYARVSPGRYLVDVECEQRHSRNLSHSEELTIDAVAGTAYVIGCVARTHDSRLPKAYVRETDPAKLKLER